MKCITIQVNGQYKTLYMGDTLTVGGEAVTLIDLENPVEHDPVKHPRHYTDVVPGIECKDVIGWFPGHVAAAMKYLWRHQQKGRPIEDLRKAIEFIQFEIERLEQIDEWTEKDRDART
jgi:hypothetical protein